MDSKSDKQLAMHALEQEGLLDGFLDGELDEAQRKRVAAVLDPIVHRLASQELEILRQSLKSFVAQSSAERITGWSAWEAIESELVPYGRTSLAERFRTFKESTAEFFDFFLRPQVAGAVFACSLALVTASVWTRSSVVQPEQSAAPMVAANSSIGTPSAADFNSVFVADESRSTLRERRHSESTFGGGDSVASVAFVGNPRLRDNHTVLAQSYNPHGLRIGSTDIDWIRAGTHIDIVPASNERRPPVIWVGQKIR